MLMMQRIGMFAVIAATLTLAATSATAAPVIVVNSGFESPAQGDGAAASGTVTGWTVNGTWGVYNTQNGQLTGTDGAVAPIGGDGVQVLFGNNGYIYQNVGAIQADTTYTLTVAIGRRIDQAFSPSGLDLILRPTGPTSSPTLAFDNVTAAEVAAMGSAGALYDFSISFNSADFVANVGQNLIVVLNLGGNDPQAIADKVRLDATANAVPVPTPAALPAGLALIVCIAARRRR